MPRCPPAASLGLVFALAGCNAISGFSSLEEVDCAGASCGSGGAGGSGGGAGASGGAGGAGAGGAGGSGGGVLQAALGVDAGRHGTCAVTLDGDVLCWGKNLGDGTGDISPTPRVIPQLAGADSFAMGLEHTCALFQGKVKCWGGSEYGQLGNGALEASYEPVAVLGVDGVGELEGIKKITAGRYHTCAETEASPVAVCWGSNEFGELGDGTREDRAYPVLVEGLPAQLEKVSAAGRHACAATVDNEVYCWGKNDAGQTGQDPAMVPSSTTPMLVPGVESRRVYTGDAHTCAKLLTNEARCWGANGAGQLGNGTTSAIQFNPVLVTGLTGVSYLNPAFSHTCALLETGGVLCWGSNEFDQLGIMGASLTPIAPSSAEASGVDMTGLSTDGEHTCAVIATDVWCWGLNDHGQIGDGTIGGSRPLTKVRLEIPAN